MEDWKKYGPRLWLIMAASVLLVVLAGCGSAADQPGNSPSTESPGPVPTYLKIQVTSAIGAEPTSEALATETPVISLGAPRPFPEILTQTEGLSIGPLMSNWQTYLTNSVFVWDDNRWDLCATLRGNSEGSFVTGAIVWTLGPPPPGLKSNEIIFGVWSPIQDKGFRAVLGTTDGAQVIKLTRPWNQYSGDPIELTGEEISFDVFDLVYCTDPRG